MQPLIFAARSAQAVLGLPILQQSFPLPFCSFFDWKQLSVDQPLPFLADLAGFIPASLRLSPR
jgi:hypothetical protein